MLSMLALVLSVTSFSLGQAIAAKIEEVIRATGTSETNNSFSKDSRTLQLKYLLRLINLSEVKIVTATSEARNSNHWMVCTQAGREASR